MDLEQEQSRKRICEQEQSRKRICLMPQQVVNVIPSSPSEHPPVVAGRIDDGCSSSVIDGAYKPHDDELLLQKKNNKYTTRPPSPSPLRRSSPSPSPSPSPPRRSSPTSSYEGCITESYSICHGSSTPVLNIRRSTRSLKHAYLYSQRSLQFYQSVAEPMCEKDHQIV